jgi:hypothetical protein
MWNTTKKKMDGLARMQERNSEWEGSRIRPLSWDTWCTKVKSRYRCVFCDELVSVRGSVKLPSVGGHVRTHHSFEILVAKYEATVHRLAYMYETYPENPIGSVEAQREHRAVMSETDRAVQYRKQILEMESRGAEFGMPNSVRVSDLVDVEAT